MQPHTQSLAYRRFNPPRPSARNIARCAGPRPRCRSGFNPTRPSARNIAQAADPLPLHPLVSIQPDPRPGISPPDGVHGGYHALVSIQPDPRPGISHSLACQKVGDPPFQSNPTLGQEYRKLLKIIGAFTVSFNPTRPSARNIARCQSRVAGMTPVSIQPDPRPGISPKPSTAWPPRSPFQSNPTLGQEYRGRRLLA